jgi:ubiquinone/menaquinone biosynthesis C-methylase UbiE
MPENLDRMAEIYGPATWDIYARLEKTLEPRGPHMLSDLAARHAVEGAVVLDVGCRDATHTIQLIQRIEGSSGLGVDPVLLHIDRAKTAVEAAGLADRLDVREGVMQRIPLEHESVDLIWCRDVIGQVDHLDDGLREMRRVIRPTGAFIVFTVFITDLLDAGDAAILRQQRGNVWENLIEPDVEQAFSAAGFQVEVKDEIGTEWREYLDERTPGMSKKLLQLARLRRQRDDIVRDHGQALYDHVEANLHGEVFQFLGKLKPVAYVLRPTTE